ALRYSETQSAEPDMQVVLVPAPVADQPARATGAARILEVLVELGLGHPVLPGVLVEQRLDLVVEVDDPDLAGRDELLDQDPGAAQIDVVLARAREVQAIGDITLQHQADVEVVAFLVREVAVERAAAALGDVADPQLGS